MTQAQSLLKIDCNQEDAYQQIYPVESLLSSYAAGWNGIRLEYIHTPAWEFPDITPSNHTVVIHTYVPSDIYYEVTFNSNQKMAQLIAGDVLVSAANVPRRACWDREITYILINLQPTYWANVAYESIDPDRAELVPFFAQSDPLIYHMGSALLSVLQIDPMGSRLYVESMATALSAHLLQHYSTRKPFFPEYSGLPKYKLRQVIGHCIMEYEVRAFDHAMSAM